MVELLTKAVHLVQPHSWCKFYLDLSITFFNVSISLLTQSLGICFPNASENKRITEEYVFQLVWLALNTPPFCRYVEYICMDAVSTEKVLKPIKC
mmetsp:Transcript_4709/g.5941  ORF Transcript_4709/g.5941 Transcript_4709/m.5941 type:complete len:95 (+) Transcript_4709:1866-2150(+)